MSDFYQERLAVIEALIDRCGAIPPSWMPEFVVAYLFQHLKDPNCDEAELQRLAREELQAVREKRKADLDGAIPPY